MGDRLDGETHMGDWTGMALLLGGVAVDDEAVWELTELVETPMPCEWSWS